MQGGFTVKQTEGAIRAVLVRISLNDDVRKRLNDSNCITPHANESALFVFRDGEVS